MHLCLGGNRRSQAEASYLNSNDRPVPDLTLTATTEPSLSLALCTCAIDADATGVLSKSSKMSSGEETPKSAATMLDTTE